MGVVSQIHVPQPPPLSPTADGAETSGQAYTLRMPGTADQPMVMISPEGHELRTMPMELAFRDGSGLIDYITGATAATLTVDDHGARYRRVFPWSEQVYADDVYLLAQEGVKNIVLLSEIPRAPAVFLGAGLEVGCSWSIGGIPLPPGEFTELDLWGFRFPRPVVRALNGAECQGRYQIVDGPEGQTMFVWWPYEWFLANPGPYSMDPTVSTSTSTLATADSHQRKIARFSNGVLIAVFFSGSELVCRYSADAGQKWLTPSAGGILVSSVVLMRSAVVIDPDDYVYVSYHDGYNVVLKRGVPDVSRTSYTWSTLSITTGTTYDNRNPVVQVHGEGTGWKVHLWWTYISTTPSSQTRYARVNVTSAGVMSLESGPTVLGGSYSTGPVTYPVGGLDAAKQLYAGWSCGSTGTSLGIQAKVASYSASVWTWGAQESVDTANYAANGVISGTVDSSSRFAVAYRKSTDNNMRVMRRTTAGVWAEVTGLPAITVATSVALIADGDDLYLWFTLSGLKYVKFDATTGTWGSIVTVDADTTATGVSSREGADGSAMDVIYLTGASSPYTVASYRLPLNSAPLAPSNLTRANYDATTDAAFTWQFNDNDPSDGQSAYQLQIRLNGAASDMVDTGYVSSPTSSHSLVGGTLTNGNTYQWRVRTKDQSGAESPWSDYATFQTGAAPVPTITVPTAGSTVASGEVTVQWSVSDQASAIVRRYAADGVTLLDTQTVTQAGARSRTLSGLANTTDYQVSVQVTSSIGVQGPEVFSGVFHVSYTPPPSPVAAVMAIDGALQVTITNPAPGAGEPAVVSNDLYRDGIRIATGITPGGTYDDYAVSSGRAHSYTVRAIGDNGTYTDSAPASGTVTYEGWRFTPVDSPAEEILFQFNWTARRSLDEGRSEVQTQGRYSITVRSPARFQRFNIAAVYSDELTEESPTAWTVRLYGLSGRLGYLRSPDGGLWYGELYAPEDDWLRDVVEDSGSIPRAVRFQFVEKGSAPVEV